ncbi:MULTISPECIES: hypothetical protein [Actinoplanes]|uniref:hypothetical protein n=1 Tax=Actinoplanes TaxID=1865 RepID=UPI0012FB3C21|nr:MULTISPECIES: hypothetical protein [Actinoplanes]
MRRTVAAWIGAALTSGFLVGIPAAQAAAAPVARVDIPANCTPVSDQGLIDGGYRGSLAEGETDCLTLDTPAGARINVLTAWRIYRGAEVTTAVVDADGAAACSGTNCTLSGPAPYRVLVTAGAGGGSVDDYGVAVQRMDQLGDCAVLPRGGYGDTVGATPRFGADRFATCYTIPASAQATSEMVSIATLTTTDVAPRAGVALTVRDSAGTIVCGNASSDVAARVATKTFRCRFDAGKAYTAVLVSNRYDATFRITRKPTVGAACQTVGTTLGGPATTGARTATDDLACYRFPATAKASYWVSGGGWVTDGTGAFKCTSTPCRVTGSSSYQVIMPAGAVGGYRLNTWNLGTPDQPAEACTRQLTGAPGGFGPFTGTLDASRTAYCAAVPLNEPTHRFALTATNTGGGSELPETYYLKATDSTDSSPLPCDRACGIDNQSGYGLLLITAGASTATIPFRATTTCEYQPCADEPFSVTMVDQPDTINDNPVPLYFVGTSFDPADRVVLTRAGQKPITAVVRNVNNFRTALTVEADITEAQAGTWDVTVTSGLRGTTATLKGAVRVSAALLRSTKAPTISGTVRVGATVKAVTGTWTPAATSYTYQWTSNGAAIKGATGAAYAIPAAQRGKRLGVTVTAKRTNRGSSAVASAATTVAYGIAPAATKKPKITGTVKVGKKVKVSVGAWSPSATSYAYEWRVAGKVVARTSTLTLKKAWSGKKLTVTVIARRTGHTDGKAVSATVTVKKK